MNKKAHLTLLYVLLCSVNLSRLQKLGHQKIPAKWAKRSKWWMKGRETKSSSNHYQNVIENGTKRDQSGSGGISNTAQFNQAVLNAHNEYRQMHHSPHLNLDDQLTKQAQDYAKELSARGISQVRNSDGYKAKKYGENIFAACDTAVLPIDPVKDWYNQVCRYDFLAHQAKKREKTRNFAQVVWRGTEKLGVGRSAGLNDKKGCTFVVAQYLPRRNPQARRNNVDIGDFNKEICKDPKYVGFGARG